MDRLILKIQINKKELLSTYGGSCTDTSQCTEDNLVCSNSTCICSDANDFYWNGTYCGKIISKLSISLFFLSQ